MLKSIDEVRELAELLRIDTLTRLKERLEGREVSRWLKVIADLWRAIIT